MPAPVRLLVGAALSAVLLAGCSDDAPPPERADPDPTPSFAEGSTHDGAVPISTVNYWIDQMQKGNGPVACALVTNKLQKAVAAATPANDSCPAAVTTLADQGDTPQAVQSFTVESATDDKTVLVTHRKKKAERVTLVSKAGQWMIDTIAPAPAADPAADPDTADAANEPTTEPEATTTTESPSAD